MDATVCTAALLAALSFLVWMSVPVVHRGVSSADDAVLAYAAKSVAIGRGYGFPRAPNQFVLFDYMISTGPALILPVAFAIRVFGYSDQVPGGATLVIFIAQLIGAGIILSRRFGWAPACGFLSALIWLLTIASANNWFFGSLLGEPVAFGFILIGTACLVAKGDRWIAAAALSFSMALLTKQIALFAVAGIIGAWILSSAYERIGRRALLRRTAILVSLTLSLPFIFEITKLVTLGLSGYREHSREAVSITSQLAFGSADASSRVAAFLKTLTESYLSTALLITLVISSMLLLVLLKRNREEQGGRVWQFAAFAWAGAAVYLGYILTVSNLRPRYFWIGIAVMLTAICAPLLGLVSGLRIATLLVLLLGTVGFGFHRPLYPLRQWVATSTAATERAAVVKLLDNNPDLPYVAQYWSSIFDVLYLRDKEGTWLYEANVNSLHDRDFVAVVHHVFTDKNGQFFKSVVEKCEPLTPDARVISAYRCGKGFWSDQSPTVRD